MLRQVRQNEEDDRSGKLRAWRSAVREWREGRHFEVQWDDNGVALVGVSPNGEPPLQLGWDQITAVYAYKRDCVTVDQIRLVLGDEKQQTWMEVSEDDIGGSQLWVELARRLPGFPAVYDWWDGLANPAFEPQWTQINRRAAPPG